MLKKCSNRCKDGVVDTGNNDLPCDCPKGSSALFNTCGVKGLVTGAESRRHFFNGSPELLAHHGKEISASSLPGRNKDRRELKKIFKQLLDLLETSKLKDMSQVKKFYTFAEKLHALTERMLGK